ncbi:MAG: N-6 DNA methylase, partial [Oscillospiraceae bacterium]|nr:N-6 DNA methylase [Oscillospiraceae bacterium]
DNDMKDIADKLWYLHQDCEVEYFIPDEMFKGGFPDSTERIKASLTDSAALQKYIDGLEDLIRQYEQDRNVLRFHFHKPKELLSRLKDLQLPKRDFITKSDFSYEPKFFVTEDEKDKLLTGGSGVQDGKFRIEKFFKEEHTEKEKIAFLKREYGDGGMGRSGFNEWHDAKGISYKKGSLSIPDCETFMKWNEVSQRIDRLIAEGRYVTQRDIDRRIDDAKRTIKNRQPDDLYNKAVIEQAHKVLEEYGVSLDEEQPVQEQTAEELTKDFAVYYDSRSDNYVEVQQTDGGIEYTVFAPDLTPIDGGEWEMEEVMELDEAAASLMQTTLYDLVELPDYDRFMNLADRNTDPDVAAEIAKLKAEALANVPGTITMPKQEPKQKQQAEPPTVNAPEKITVTKNEPKSGVPYTYHFNANDVVTGGAKSKFKANVEAIQVLQKIEAENRYATPEEQSVMAKYVGWGGIPQAFTTDRAAESLGGNLGEAAPSGWETEQKQLRELLSPDEYKAARASTLTSFYTPPEVTDGIYQALSQFGFEGGNVLEPSMGVGNFFSKMPENMRDNSRLYGVELDSISGRIAQQLYPKERIQIKGFEQTSFNNNSFDVVVGNIPFGDYRVSDKAYDKHNFKIHDYFAAKSVDKVKPGGVVALVTSKFTMDKLNEKARRYLAERCDLLGAVRLPNTAFKQNAGTEVTTDILFLKKRETMTVEVPDWVHMSETADGIPCNKYFVDNPDMVLGTMAWDERMKCKYGDYRRVTTCVADESIPLSEQLKAAIAKIEGSIETVRAEEKQRDEADIIPA